MAVDALKQAKILPSPDGKPPLETSPSQPDRFPLPEDKKIHRFVIAGEILQSLAVVLGAAATITACITLIPFILIAIIPCVGLHLLGGYLFHFNMEVKVGRPLTREDFHAFSLIEHHPIGLKNRGNDCFANTIMHFLTQDPEMHAVVTQGIDVAIAENEQNFALLVADLAAIEQGTDHPLCTLFTKIRKAETFEALDRLCSDSLHSELMNPITKNVIRSCFDSALSTSIRNLFAKKDFRFCNEPEKDRYTLTYLSQQISGQETMTDGYDLLSTYPTLRNLVHRNWPSFKEEIVSAIKEQLARRRAGIEENIRDLQGLTWLKNLVAQLDEETGKNQVPRPNKENRGNFLSLSSVNSGHLRQLLPVLENLHGQEDPHEVLACLLSKLTPSNGRQHNPLLGPKTVTYRANYHAKPGSATPGSSQSIGFDESEATYSIACEVSPFVSLPIDDSMLKALQDKAVFTDATWFTTLFEEAMRDLAEEAEEFDVSPEQFKVDERNKIPLMKKKESKEVFTEAPSALTFQLKRFRNIREGQHCRVEKLDQKLPIPFSFDLPSHLCLNTPNNELDFGLPLRGQEAIDFKNQHFLDHSGKEGESPGRYKLDFFIKHIGTTPRSGHYICYVHKETDDGKGCWLCCDDTNVSVVDEEAVMKAASESYVFRYHKVDSPPSSPSSSIEARLSEGSTGAEIE